MSTKAVDSLDSGTAVLALGVRVLGVLFAVVGAIALAWSVRETDRRSRGADVAFAVLAPLAVLIALLGLLLAFVPSFLG